MQTNKAGLAICFALGALVLLQGGAALTFLLSDDETGTSVLAVQKDSPMVMTVNQTVSKPTLTDLASSSIPEKKKETSPPQPEPAPASLTPKVPDLPPAITPLPPVSEAPVAGVKDPVNSAIDKGVAYLREHQNKNGTWGAISGHPVGYTALPGLTLLECGVARQDRTVQKAAAFVRQNVSKLGATYELSLAILFLDRLGEEQDTRLIRMLALRLVAGQTAAGGWTYDVPLLQNSEADQLFAFLEKTRPLPLSNPLKTDFSKLTPKAGPFRPEFLPRSLQNIPAVVHQGKKKSKEALRPGWDDNSNSQFAMLALWTARRHGVASEMSLLLAHERYRVTQHPEGGWSYTVHRLEPTAPMTCVGLLGLAMGYGTGEMSGNSATREFANAPKNDRAIQAGINFLAGSIGSPAPAHVVPAMENLYFLWSLERVGMLYNLKLIGGKDWYLWGSRILVANQLKEGSWQSSHYPGSAPTIDTCFALLFLKRSNLVQDLTQSLQLAAPMRERDGRRE